MSDIFLSGLVLILAAYGLAIICAAVETLICTLLRAD